MTATHTKRETWEGWLPEDAPKQTGLITRDMLVNRLAHEGWTVTSNDFRYWQAEGILPQPIKRWDGDATRAFYPALMVDVIALLLRLRAQGRTIRSMGPNLKQLAGVLSGAPSVLEARMSTVPRPTPLNDTPLLEHVWNHALEEATESLKRLSVVLEAKTGQRFSYADLVFSDRDESFYTVPFTLGAQDPCQIKRSTEIDAEHLGCSLGGL